MQPIFRLLLRGRAAAVARRGTLLAGRAAAAGPEAVLPGCGQSASGPESLDVERERSVDCRRIERQREHSVELSPCR